MEYEYKRLRGILASYEEKREDIGSAEYADREKVAELLKESTAMFQMTFNEQTRRFEQNQFNSRMGGA